MFSILEIKWGLINNFPKVTSLTNDESGSQTKVSLTPKPMSVVGLETLWEGPSKPETQNSTFRDSVFWVLKALQGQWDGVGGGGYWGEREGETLEYSNTLEIVSEL